MVYIEHDTTEPVIEDRAAHTRIAEHHHKRRSQTMRWFMMGAVAAVIVYLVVVLYGWKTVSDVFTTLHV